MRGDTLAHEAGHVVGTLLAGHRIKAVQLGGTKKNPANSGMTFLDWDASPDRDLYGHLIAVLMGPMAEGQPPPSWPPLPSLTDDTADEHVAAHLVVHLKLSKSDYLAAVGLAARWLDDPLVKAAIAKLAHALGQTGVLTDRMVRDVLGRNMTAWFESTPRSAQRGHLCST